MKTRNFALCALGLAAAISMGAETASAQARSQTRIPVRKDEPAEAPKVDTVFRVRVDTVTIRGRTDTVVRTVTGPMRYDTVMVQPPLQRLPGLYFGLGAGLAIPMNNWRNSTKDGPAIQGIIGWFPANGNLGFRVDGLANFMSNRDQVCATCPKPKIYEANADVVLRFPLDRRSTLNPVIYVMGGGGIDKITDFLPYTNTQNRVVTAGADTYLTYPGIPLSATASAANFRGNKSLHFNWNAGAGMDWRAFGLNWYVETKYTNINTTGITTTGTQSTSTSWSHYWPVTVGLKFW